MALFGKKEESVRCSAVVLAAGDSQRMGEDKALIELSGMPVLVRSISAFQKSALIDEIIVVTKSDKIEEIADMCNKYELTKVKKVIAGGSSRMESSLAGVSAVSKKAELIAIHDGARPLVSQKLIKNGVYTAKEFNSAVPAVKSSDTLRVKDGEYVGGFIDRDSVVRIQTPQIFSADIIKGALTRAVEKKLELTDDASALPAIGFKVKLFEGDPTNIKLTVPSDLPVAEALLAWRSEEQ